MPHCVDSQKIWHYTPLNYNSGSSNITYYYYYTRGANFFSFMLPFGCVCMHNDCIIQQIKL